MTISEMTKTNVRKIVDTTSRQTGGEKTILFKEPPFVAVLSCFFRCALIRTPPIYQQHSLDEGTHLQI